MVELVARGIHVKIYELDYRISQVHILSVRRLLLLWRLLRSPC